MKSYNAKEKPIGTERSDKIYESYLQARQKFDYFVVSVSFALVGYLGTQYRPMPLGWNASTVELGALACCLLSAIVGLKHIQSTVHLIAIMHRRLYDEEMAGNLMSTGMSGNPAVNESTGQVFSAQQMIERAERHRKSALAIAEKLDDMGEDAAALHQWRNVLLIGGLVLLVCSRVFAAYVSGGT